MGIHTCMHTRDAHLHAHIGDTPLHPFTLKGGRLLTSAKIVDTDYNTILGHNTLRSINRIKLLTTVRDDLKRRKMPL